LTHQKRGIGLIEGKIIVMLQMIEEVALHVEEGKNGLASNKELHYRRSLFILNIIEYHNKH
jgi:hypothetical protein